MLCPNCGAHLPAEYGTIKCRYCGKEAFIKRPESRRPVATGGQSNSPAAKLVLIAAVGVFLVGLGGAVAIPLLLSSREEAGLRIANGRVDPASAEAIQEAQRALEEAFGKSNGQTSPALPAVERVSLDSRVCLLADVDDDGVGEVGALVDVGESREKVPAILNGATGEPVWQGEPLGDDSDIHQLCVGSRWLAAVDNQNFELLMVNAHDTQRHVRRALSDELDRYGVGEDCLALRTEDRAQLGLSLKDGSEQACNTATRRRPHIEDSTTCGIISTLRRGASFDLDGVAFHLGARRPGTPFLQASARRGRQELWDVPLRLVPVSGEAIGCFVGVATPGVFVVLGAPRGDDHAITALGLNAESGTERYAVDIGGSFGRVRELFFNGRYVVIGLLRRALALDPATGATAWQYGS